MNSTAAGPGHSHSDRRAVFWACFTAIAATAAVFAVRGQVIGDWAREFGLSETSPLPPLHPCALHSPSPLL